MRNSLLWVLYSIILLIAMLYPFNFDFNTNNAQWLVSESGIYFEEEGQIISDTSTSEFYEKLVQGNGLTVEVWMKTDNLTQNGPARIISYSVNTSKRNFTLGQSEDKLVMRLRTERTDSNGIFPHMVVPHVFVTTQKTHIVVTYDFNRQCLFVNGKNQTCTNIPKGDFSNWDPSFPVVIGNEASGYRPWLGKIYYAAVYDQALDAGEITQKFNHGIPIPEGSKPDEVETLNYPIVRYDFSEKEGSLVKDTGMGGFNLDLHIPKRMPPKPNMLGINDLRTPKDIISTLGNLFHFLLFIPLGIFLHRFLMLRFKSTFYAVSIGLIAGLVVAFNFEILQHFLPDRTSSIDDVIVNLIGLSFGILLEQLHLERGKHI